MRQVEQNSHSQRALPVPINAASNLKAVDEEQTGAIGFSTQLVGPDTHAAGVAHRT